MLPLNRQHLNYTRLINEGSLFPVKSFVPFECIPPDLTNRLEHVLRWEPGKAA